MMASIKAVMAASAKSIVTMMVREASTMTVHHHICHNHSSSQRSDGVDAISVGLLVVVRTAFTAKAVIVCRGTGDDDWSDIIHWDTGRFDWNGHRHGRRLSSGRRNR